MSVEGSGTGSQGATQLHHALAGGHVGEGVVGYGVLGLGGSVLVMALATSAALAVNLAGSHHRAAGQLTEW